MSKTQAGRQGGRATLAKHGRAHFVAIGKLGGRSFWQRYFLIPSGAAGWAIVNRRTGEIRAYNGSCHKELKP